MKCDIDPRILKGLDTYWLDNTILLKAVNDILKERPLPERKRNVKHKHGKDLIIF